MQTQASERLKAHGLSALGAFTNRSPFCRVSHFPLWDSGFLALSRTLGKSPYSSTCLLAQPQKKQPLYCLLLAACISQDGFHRRKCHLFALDQHQEYCVGVWDADTHMASRLPAHRRLFTWLVMRASELCIAKACARSPM